LKSKYFKTSSLHFWILITPLMKLYFMHYYDLSGADLNTMIFGFLMWIALPFGYACYYHEITISIISGNKKHAIIGFFAGILIAFLWNKYIIFFQHTF